MIVGFAGKKQHGKDTAAIMWSYFHFYGTHQNFQHFKFVREIEGFTSVLPNLKFADKLKDILCLLTGCTRAQLEDEDFKNSFMDFTWNVNNKPMTYRQALQLIGTNALRDHFHPEVWVNATMVDAYYLKDCTISDVRFPNEVTAIEKQGGVIIHINRKNLTSTDEHASETALDNHDWKYKIDVDSGIELLFDALKLLYLQIQNEHEDNKC